MILKFVEYISTMFKSFISLLSVMRFHEKGENMFNKLKCFAFVVILSFSLSLTILFPLSSATPTKTVYVDPPKVIYDIHNATLGTRFNVTVWISSSSYPWKLMMWQVYTKFNDDLINVTEVWVDTPGKWVIHAWPNDYLEGRSWDPDYIFYNTAGGFIGNPTYYHLGSGSGALMIGDLLMSDKSITATKKLCTIEFEIVRLPEEGQTLSCVLNIDNSDTFFYDSQGKITDLTIQDGYYEISYPGLPPPQRMLTINSAVGGSTVPPTGTYTYNNGTLVTITAYPNAGYLFSHWILDAQTNTSNPINILMDRDYELTPVFTLMPTNESRIFVDPPEIIDPTMVPSSTFAINITIDDVVNMQVCTFNLTYDTNVLSWAGIKLIRVSGQLPKANVECNDDAGYIWAKLTYTSPVSTVEPLALFEIIFHVENLGSSILDLHDTEILDSGSDPVDHDVYDGFFMSLIRDVAIINVIPSRAWAYQGWPVNIAVKVKNLGNISETFNVEVYYDDDLIGTATVTNLAPNEELDLVIPWNTSGVEEGTYTIRAEAGVVPYEIDTSNNVYVDGTVQILTVIRDVAVTEVVVEQNWAYKGWLVQVNVTVENLGEVAETFNVALYYDGHLVNTYDIIGLTPHTSFVVSFMWNTSSAEPCHNYTLSAEASEVPYEYDTTNNIYVDGAVKLRLMGDVNEDGLVNMLDLYEVSLSFGFFKGDPEFNMYADINKDGFINMLDLYLVAQNFGNAC
jgi:hypothetical protein